MMLLAFLEQRRYLYQRLSDVKYPRRTDMTNYVSSFHNSIDVVHHGAAEAAAKKSRLLSWHPVVV